MPITDDYARLPLPSIHVARDERQRREIDTKGLIESVRLRGVVNPIIVERELGPEGKHRLCAGERRYTASIELGLPDIPVRFVDELSPTEAQILELEENIKRQQLNWRDEALAIQRIHQLYCEINVAWMQDQTAYELGLSKGQLSVYLIVAAKIDLVPNSTTLREAYNVITRRAEREKAAELDWLIHGEPITSIHEANTPAAGPPPPSLILPSNGLAPTLPLVVQLNPAKNILLESFLHWAPKYIGQPFNLIHCDFPYGISVFDGPQAGGERHHQYDDSREIHFQLLETLLIHFDRLASTSCHVIYWFSIQHYDTIRKMVRELTPDLHIHTHPLIWHKTDNSGIASDPRRTPRHVYETALLMSRGRRPLVKLSSDVYGAPTDNSLHIHTKPEPMLRYFFSMFVDEHTVFLDPTCGSGSSLRAAESLGAGSVLGMDTDETVVGQARVALRHARAKRSASVASFAL